MGTTIEKNIVQMDFDAKTFHKGIEQSLRDIQELKDAFQMENAAKGMQELDKASRISFDPLTKSIGALNSKISLLGVAAAVVVSKITSAVIDGAKKIADVLLIQPIVTGLEEYETQLNAVQTILANTSKDGTTLKNVNDALDDLNRYADLTIYNFTQMTDSIGKFTAAGVDLETSTTAIKGIANVAALSGSNAQQASTAMYQMSQAIASGTVRLQDWMSIENAGMGGQVFQDALKETAEVHGVVVDDMIAKSGSFRNTLQENWLTSDIMLETLSKFTGDLTDAELESLGYTKEQIAGIQEVATLANDAATKIKTLTQLKETMAEAMQSGWATTWRIIFGDFEQAKELWGGIAEIFGSLIDNSSQARNSMLEMWASVGGRVAIINAFKNVLEGMFNIIGGIGAGFRDIFEPLTYVDLFQISFQILRISEAFVDMTQNTGPLRSIVRGIAAGIDILRLAAQAVLKPIIELISTWGPAAGSFTDSAVGIADAVVAFREFAIETDFFNNAVANAIKWVQELIQQAQEMVDAFMELEIIQDISEYFGSLGQEDFLRVWEGFLSVLRPIAGALYLVALGAQELYRWFSKLDIVEKVAEYFGEISYSGLKEGFSDAATAVTEFMEGLKDIELLGKFKEYFDTFDGRRFTQFLADAKEGFSWIGDVIGQLTDQMSGLDTGTQDTTEGVNKVGQAINDGLTRVMDFLITSAKNLDYSALFDAINTGLLAGLLLSFRSIAQGDFITNAFENLFGEDSTIGGVITDTLDEVQGSLSAFQTNLKADSLQKIAIAIALLAGSIALLTLIDHTKLTAATAAIALMVATLFGSAGALKSIKTQDALKAAAAIGAMSVSLIIVAGALKSLQGIKAEELETTMKAMTGGLVGLVLSVNALSRGGGGGDLLKTVGLLFGLSAALYILLGAVKRFGEMNPETLSQGLRGIGISLAMLSTSMVVITKLGGGGMLTAAIAITDMALALIILGESVNRFGGMDPDELYQGLQAVGVVLAGFAGFSILLQPQGMIGASIGIAVISAALLIMVEVVKRFGAIDWEELQRGLIGLGAALLLVVIAANVMTGALAGAAAMIVMAAAIAILAVSIKILSTLSWEELAIAIAGLAAVFVVLGLAGLLLAPIVPVLLALGAAMLLIGAGAALMGIGLLAAATGLVALAASAAPIAAAVTAVGLAIISILPQMGAAIAEAFVNFITTIAEAQPKIMEAMKQIMLGMIKTVADLIPEIVSTMMDMVNALLEAIADRLPDMIQSGFDILMAFLQGIADNIAEIIATGLMIVTEIINGIAEGLPDLIDSAFNLILTFLDAIADAIEQYMPKIIAAGIRIGEAIVNGIVEAVKGGVAKVGGAVYDLANQVIQKLKDLLGISSPSTVTYEMGGFFVQGLINGILAMVGKVKDTARNFAQKAKEGMDAALTSTMADIENEFELTPKITPVVDLGQVQAGADSISSAFSGGATLASLTSSQGYISDEREKASATTGLKEGVSFVQNNYSPKALDRAAIYRQTKTYVARLALEEI